MCIPASSNHQLYQVQVGSTEGSRDEQIIEKQKATTSEVFDAIQASIATLGWQIVPSSSGASGSGGEARSTCQLRILVRVSPSIHQHVSLFTFFHMLSQCLRQHACSVNLVHVFEIFVFRGWRCARTRRPGTIEQSLCRLVEGIEGVRGIGFQGRSLTGPECQVQTSSAGFAELL